MPLTLSRRNFVRSGTLLLTAGAVFSPSLLLQACDKMQQTKTATGTLVVLYLYGGLDTVNAFVPTGHFSGAYHDFRGNLAIPADQTLPLAGNKEIALHPALTELGDFWKRGQLALVRGLGYAAPDRSHFASTSIVQTGLGFPHNDGSEGLLARLLAQAGGRPDRQGHLQGGVFSGLDIEYGLSEVFKSERLQVPAIGSSSDFSWNVPDEPRQVLVSQLYHHYDAQAPFGALLRLTAEQDDAAITQLQAADAGYKEAPGVMYDGDLGASFRFAAEVITQKLGAQVIFLGLGGFDTHDNQGVLTGVLPTLLQSVSLNISMFFKDLAARGLDKDVVVMTLSEFGRNQSNDSSGTDHGEAGTQMVLGPRVRGGIYGDMPDLQHLNDTALRMTTHWGTLYSSVFEGLFQVSGKDVLGASYPTLPLIR
jgi:uncharacterized protein (DUF1501 family)